MLQRIRSFVRDTKAVSALEYAILVGVIAVAIAGAMFTFGGNLTKSIGAVGSDIQNMKTPGAPNMKNKTN